MRGSPRGCVDRKQDTKRATIQHSTRFHVLCSVASRKNMKASYTHLRDLQDEQATANEGDIRPGYLLDEMGAVSRAFTVGPKRVLSTLLIKACTA